MLFRRTASLLLSERTETLSDCFGLVTFGCSCQRRTGRYFQNERWKLIGQTNQIFYWWPALTLTDKGTRSGGQVIPPELCVCVSLHVCSQGVKEVTLLGQNVNSYRDLSEQQFSGGGSSSQQQQQQQLSRGFQTIYRPRLGGLRFCHLLDRVSRIDPDMRIRFTSPHPKDFPDEVRRSTPPYPRPSPLMCGSRSYQ